MKTQEQIPNTGENLKDFPSTGNNPGFYNEGTSYNPFQSYSSRSAHNDPKSYDFNDLNPIAPKKSIEKKTNPFVVDWQI
jgi:hypothetical protein